MNTDAYFYLLLPMMQEEIELHRSMKTYLFRQQKAILDKNIDDLIDTQVFLNTKLEELMKLQSKREAVFKEYLKLTDYPQGTRMSIPLKEVVGEIGHQLNELVHHLNMFIKNNRRLTKINRYLCHQLLSAAQDFLHKISPGKFLKMYTPKGKVKSAEMATYRNINFLA